MGEGNTYHLKNKACLGDDYQLEKEITSEFLGGYLPSYNVGSIGIFYRRLGLV